MKKYFYFFSAMATTGLEPASPTFMFCGRLIPISLHCKHMVNYALCFVPSESYCTEVIWFHLLPAL